MDLLFARPEFLLFLTAVPLLVLMHLYGLRYVRRRALRFSNFEVIDRITGGETVPKNYGAIAMRLLTITCFILAAAGTTFVYDGTASSSDYAIVIDASSSMIAQDLAPNRLDAAKAAATTFIDSLPPGARISVTSFSGTAFVKLRPTNDYGEAKKTISALTIEAVGGTAIGEAIITSSNLMVYDKSEKPKSIILLTDGQNNVGASVNDAIAYAKNSNVIVDTIGVGTPEGGNASTSVITRLDDASLKKIASETGGAYFYASDAQGIADAYNRIIKSAAARIPVNLTAYLIIIALLMVIIDWGMSYTIYRILP